VISCSLVVRRYICHPPPLLRMRKSSDPLMTTLLPCCPTTTHTQTHSEAHEAKGVVADTLTLEEVNAAALSFPYGGHC
jgi:hypothetical protein